MAETWTIRRVLQWMSRDFSERGIPTARLDAELLVAHVLLIDRVRLYMDLDRPLVPAELAQIRDLTARRRKFEPIAYILGRKEFYGRTFVVSNAVLVPRPDTEILVERALELLPKDRELRVLDLCAGSGCIGITLALERSLVRVDLTEIADDAALVAEKNAGLLGCGDRVRVLVGDLFAPIGAERYSIITANPPYIANTELSTLAADVRSHEPHGALSGGETGLEFYPRIAAGALTRLEPAGALLVEVGANQSASVQTIFRGAGFEDVRAHRDLAGIERVVEGRLPDKT